MKESYGKGIANHPDPESCAGRRKAAGEALTGAQAGRRVLSCEIHFVRAPTLFREAEGHIMRDDKREPLTSPAQSETPDMPGNSMRENRETPKGVRQQHGGRLEKATSYKAGMHASGESDEQIAPTKRANNEHRIADRRILRLIRKWLKAGGSVSPLPANIYLHYVFDCQCRDKMTAFLPGMPTALPAPWAGRHKHSTTVSTLHFGTARRQPWVRQRLSCPDGAASIARRRLAKDIGDVVGAKGTWRGSCFDRASHGLRSVLADEFEQFGQLSRKCAVSISDVA
jgi:hypothetical protein